MNPEAKTMDREGLDRHAETLRASVLLVDDDPVNLNILGALLKPYYTVLAAPSGERAFLVAADTPRPDLMLLDVSMPGMDGYEVLVRLRDNPATRDIPVIFVTGMDSLEDEQRGFELGAVDYIAKPYNTSIVLARVRTQIELKRARDRLASQNDYLETELARRLKENQQVQLQLLQSEKLAAVGQLAAGIVHEINNPVGFVAANLRTLGDYLADIYALLDAYQFLEDRCQSDQTALAEIRKIKQQRGIDLVRGDSGNLLSESLGGLARVTKIISDLKGFCRAENADWQRADLRKGLEATLNIIWNEIKYHCLLHKDYGEIPEVYCIPSQIDQVLMNLLVNAAQAIPDKGEITIRTGQLGGEVFIAISDTGTGIPAEALPRLFEPFYTTKPVGKGTGLGLSIAYGIVQNHKGRIEVESTPGKGTTFTVWLPIEPPDGLPG
jgi:signal transduction histidine kinase